jgi:hypothetical protein
MPGGAMVNRSSETVWSTLVARNCLMDPLQRSPNLVSDTAQYGTRDQRLISAGIILTLASLECSPNTTHTLAAAQSGNRAQLKHTRRGDMAEQPCRLKS